MHHLLLITGAGLGVLTSQAGGPQNLQQPPMCPSPSAHSDSSSGNGRLSSAGSEPGTLHFIYSMSKKLFDYSLGKSECNPTKLDQ